MDQRTPPQSSVHLGRWRRSPHRQRHFPPRYCLRVDCKQPDGLEMRRLCRLSSDRPCARRTPYLRCWRMTAPRYEGCAAGTHARRRHRHLAPPTPHTSGPPAACTGGPRFTCGHEYRRSAGCGRKMVGRAAAHAICDSASGGSGGAGIKGLRLARRLAGYQPAEVPAGVPVSPLDCPAKSTTSVTRRLGSPASRVCPRLTWRSVASP
jgi:hypothetical protein